MELEPDLFEAACKQARRRGISMRQASRRLSDVNSSGIDLRDTDGQLLLHLPWRQLPGFSPPPLNTEERISLNEGAKQEANAGFDHPWLRRWLLPVNLGLAVVVNAIPLSRWLLQGIGIWFHEFGHAFVAWMSGRRALPLPIGWTTVESERSPVVFVLLLILALLLLIPSLRQQKRLGIVLALTLILLQLLGWFALPTSGFNSLLSWSGVAGELILPTVLIVASFYRLPRYFNWKVYRIPCQFAACVCLVRTVIFWQRVRLGLAPIPFGSIWSANHGDMNDLIASGWSTQTIISSYTTLSWICMAMITGIYLIQQRTND